MVAMAPMVAVWCSDHSAFLIHSSRSSGLVRITCAHLVPGMLPIIAMTASAFEEDKREAIAAGMNGHIAKPIDVNELMAILVENIR